MVGITSRQALALLVLSGLCLPLAHAEFSVPTPGVPTRVEIDGEARQVDLERFELFAPDIEIVIGQRGGPDLPLAERPDVTLWRGELRDEPGTRVFLVTGHRVAGTLQRADGSRFALRAEGDALRALAVTQVRRDLPVALCGVTGQDASDFGPQVGRVLQNHPERRLLRLAVETDYELFSLFDDTAAELAYLAEMYGAVSDIFIRDVNTRVELSFIRLWTTPDDLFNQPNPLGNFRNYWQNNMQSVPRDLAQFCSGRRDLPYGGVAYLRTICGANGYSVSGYNLGFVLDPDVVHGYNRDIIINAHELGHNFNARHSHDYGYDDCGSDMGAPERGTIMSYCGQTRTGGDGNIDLRFDARIAGIMRNYVNSTCAAVDCDGDSVPDPGDAPDLNQNQVPDSCEDCDNNGIADPNDIAGGALDMDLDGIPDVCQPDCNGNGIVDAYELALLQVDDLDHNGIPDECQLDCDGSGVADAVEISADMTLDVDRNALMDACEDCDNDGVDDQTELDGAYNVWLAVHNTDQIFEFHARSGVKLTSSVGAGLAHVNDVQIPEPGRILLTDGPNSRIVEYSTDGSLVGDLVAPGMGGLIEPTQMLLPGDGTLLVVDRSAPAVRRFNVFTGASLGEVVDATALTAPFGITASPRGTWCITEQDGRVLEFSAIDGSLLGTLVALGDNGGLTNPHGLLFTPDGRLLVCSRGTDQVLEYDGVSGAFLRQFNLGGTSDRLPMDQPFCIRLGPDNDIYVSRHAGHDHDPMPFDQLHLTDARIYHFDQYSGFFVRAYVVGNDNNIGAASAFAFHPGRAQDCNFNQLLDSCELAAQPELDGDGNGVIDACECVGDANGDGRIDLTDLAILLAFFGETDADVSQGDLNGDTVVNLADLSLLLSRYREPCLVPLP